MRLPQKILNAVVVTCFHMHENIFSGLEVLNVKQYNITALEHSGCRKGKDHTAGRDKSHMKKEAV